MSLYFESIVETPFKNVINTHLAWHPQASCLAVAAYSEEKGGIVCVFTGETNINKGKVCEDVEIPPHPTAQVTVIAWHPFKRILAIGWESGELFIYNDHEHELHEIQSLHRSPLSVLHFSSGGKRLVTADTSGSVVGWNADNNGNVQTSFSHELKDPLSQIVFRVSVSADRMAAAMDINSWRPRTGHKRMTFMSTNKDNLNFFLGSTSGVVYHINEAGNCNQVLQAEGGVKRLLHHSGRNLLVVITEGLVLGQFSVEIDGSVRELNKVKLSGRSTEIQVTWATEGLLAVSTGDGFVRLWNLDSGDNFVLDLREPLGYKTQEHVLCISYSGAKRTLCAGTNMGNIAMWKHEESPETESDPEKEWKLQPPAALTGAVTQIAWGSSLNLLAANTVKEVYILNEKDMVGSFKDKVSVVQVSPTQLIVEVFSSKSVLDVKTDIQVRGVSNTNEHIVVWNNKRMVVYEINTLSSNTRIIDSFSCESDAAVMHENSIFSIEGSSIQVRSFQGTVKQTLSFQVQEGEPVALDVCGNFLVVGTLYGTIKLWDLSRREAKIHHQGKQVNDTARDFGEIISVHCNCNGTRVSIAVAQTSLLPDPKLYIWDIENDIFTFFNFATGKPEDDDTESMVPPNSADSRNSHEVMHQDRTKRETAKEVGGRFVIRHSWDAEDSRLLVCEAKSQVKEKEKKNPYGKKPAKKEKASTLLVSIFVTSEHGMIVYDAFSMLPDYSRFLGVHVPFLYLINSPEKRSKFDSDVVTQKVMRDFVGLEEADKVTRDAMLNFSFFLSIGNMDEAFKSIKSIKSETVWENMAKMCVKTKRLDVASLCLGNMGHARGARALRFAMNEPQLDAKVAMLALQLGMIEEAERLYKSCGRFDLINKMYQDAGVWSKALETAERDDRIHLRSTHYNYAKHLENKGDLSGAINHYEKSDTYRFEVPRMLFDELPTLEDYIMHTDDRGLRRWWAQYLESTGEMETALQFYEAAGDHLSLVRVYCYCNNLDKAADIANATGDRAACYHLARQYENVDQVKEAIHFFSRAQAYGNAIRICKENSFDDQLMNLALVAGPQEQIDAARYFLTSERPQVNKSVMLYHKAGLISKAVDLAFKSGQTNTPDPSVIRRCAEYFNSLGQYDRAVHLLVTGKQYIEALDLCIQHNVRVTEELAERFTLPSDERSRNEILEKVAECAYAQENYKLATKKFTQAGNKVKAMKCLLKSGDTERIVYFANVCRQRDIYIMAANYLQTLDLRKEPENYEKACVALKEAYKCIANSDEQQANEKKEEIMFKLEKVQQFVELKMLLNGTDRENAIRVLYEMLSEPNIDSAVRKGDIYATLIENHANSGNYKVALGILQEMKSKIPKVNPSYYVSTEVLQNIGRATGMPFDDKNNLDEGSEEEGAMSEEEVIDEEEDGPGTATGHRLPFLNGSAKFL
ncbi:Intraflagellar transport protein [Armadillidium nasatum]|uniref:Intraflagellar transport protein n=1 Tax=Armadillidium nasatum TaxID=96803 RepID=A0A5N5SJ28_9CRUS|nr:Intraflagellar transport protein [Armadillidium nasatum]